MAREDFDQAVFLTMLAAYMELVRELQRNGHVKAENLAARLDRVAKRFENREDRRWSVKMLEMMTEALKELGEGKDG